MDDRSDPATPKAGLTRRHVVGAAAWTAPAIVVATAVPAFAASDSVLTPMFNVDSFRTNSADQFLNGQPTNGTYAIGVRIDLTVSGTPISDLTATLTSRAGSANFTVFNNGVGARGATTWPANQGALDQDGWTYNRTPNDTLFRRFVFRQLSDTFSTGLLRFVIGGFPPVAQTGTAFPATLTFSSPSLPVSRTVTISTPVVGSPFVTGTVS